MTTTLLGEFASRPEAPFRIWLSPGARENCEKLFRNAFRTSVEIHPVPGSHQTLRGPSVLVLAAGDLMGPHRRALLECAQAALPGRPLVVGGGRHKETLLDAINTWHAYRLLPADMPGQAVVEAARGAYHTLSLELSMRACAEQVSEKCRRLEAAVEELQAGRQRLLHAERLAVVGRVMSKLLTHAQHHLVRLQDFTSIQREVMAAGAMTEDVECAAEAVSSFAMSLKDMLALAENRVMQVELEAEPLDPLVGRATRLFSYDPLARQRKIVTELGSRATVTVDRCRILHVLLNLLHNAAQATPEGGLIEVRTSRRAGGVLIEIQDFGHGMTAEVQAQLFTPFFTTKGSQGTGMGLSLSRAAIESQGGTLDCVSAPGEGTRFEIRLPLAG